MKFLADMGISPKTVAFLRSLVAEAAHLHEQGLDQLPDRAILDKARDALEQGAVISVTEGQARMRSLPINET